MANRGNDPAAYLAGVWFGGFPGAITGFLIGIWQGPALGWTIFAGCLVAGALLFGLSGSKDQLPRTYAPGSAYNPHPYQSRAWYAHESLMEQERQTEMMRPKSWD